MEFLPQDIHDYAVHHTSSEPELLKQLNAETHLKVLMPRMLSGHLQGRFLAMIAHMIQPKYILEIGTYTGYSALCMAEGLTKDGKIITIDKNDELASFAQKYFDQSVFKSQIDYRIGLALDILPELKETFDLVFIDADKVNYLNYFNLVIEKVRKGGFVIADNVLWSGKVVDASKKDKNTQAMKVFNRWIEEDNRVENVLLPIRDGLMMIRKK